MDFFFFWFLYMHPPGCKGANGPESLKVRSDRNKRVHLKLPERESRLLKIGDCEADEQRITAAHGNRESCGLGRKPTEVSRQRSHTETHTRQLHLSANFFHVGLNWDRARLSRRYTHPREGVVYHILNVNTPIHWSMLYILTVSLACLYIYACDIRIAYALFAVQRTFASRLVSFYVFTAAQSSFQNLTNELLRGRQLVHYIHFSHKLGLTDIIIIIYFFCVTETVLRCRLSKS